MVPAAHITTVSGPLARCTAPITWLSVGSSLPFGPRRQRIHGGEPFLLEAGRRGREALVGERVRQHFEADTGIRAQRLGAVFHRVVGCDVQRDELACRVLEEAPRTGCEILEPRADAEDEIGLRAHDIGARRAGDANGSEVHFVIPGERRLAGLAFDDGNPVLRGKGLQRRRRTGVMNAAAGNDHRLLGIPQERCDRFQFDRVRMGPAGAPDPRLEEVRRIIVGLGLDILTEGKAHRSAVGRVGHRSKGTGQGGEQVFGPRDPVEIAGHGPEAVISRNRAVGKVLDLLENRIGSAARKHVARNEQQRQTVDMGERGGSHHVGGAGADRRGHRHGPAAAGLLGEGDRRMGHRLLVVAAPGLDRRPLGIERFTDAGYIAMAEDRPDAGQERLAGLGQLDAQIFHHRLGGGEPDRCHAASSFVARAVSHSAQSRS